MTPEESQFILNNIGQLISNTNLKSGTLLTLLVQTELTEEEKQTIESNVHVTEYQRCYEFYRIMRMKTNGYTSLMTAFRDTKHTQAYDILKSFNPPENASSLSTQVQKCPISNTIKTDTSVFKNISTQTNGNFQSETPVDKSTQTDSLTISDVFAMCNGASRSDLESQLSQLSQTTKSFINDWVIGNLQNSNFLLTSFKEVESNNHLDGIENVHSFKCSSEVSCFQCDKTKLISGHLDGKIRIWDMATLCCVKTLDSHGVNSTSSLQFNDKIIASADTTKILLWNINSHKVFSKFNGNADFTKLKVVKNKLLALERRGKLFLFNYQGFGGLRVEAKIQAHAGESYALDADDELVITGSNDKTVKVWKFPSLKPVMTIIGHNSGVYHVSYFKRIVVSGDRESIRLWNVDSGKCLKVLIVQENTMCCLAFDGIRIASGHDNGTVQIWGLDDILNGDFSDTDSCRCNIVRVNDSRVTDIYLDEHSIVVSTDNTVHCFKFVKYYQVSSN